jgi:hypothetical protein
MLELTDVERRRGLGTGLGGMESTAAGVANTDGDPCVTNLCKPLEVYVPLKPVKRGI